MNTFLISLVAFLSFSTWYLSPLPRNYLAARKSGLPIRFGLWGSANPLWLLICTLLGYSTLSKILPRIIFDRVKITIPAWEHYCKYFVHEKWGTSFILVSPAGNTIFIGDPEVAEEVLTRRKDFGKIEIALQIMEVFGPNISASENENWQRHRRIVAPALNERVMNAVWNESLTQTQDMLSALSNPSTIHGSRSTNATFEGLRTITINVIGFICFGTHRSWGEAASAETHAGFQTTFMSSVLTIVDNLFATVFIPAKCLTLPFMPNAVKKIGIAKNEFPRHLNQSIAEERRLPRSRSSLITSLVKIADQDTKSRSSKTSTYLTEEEITGNLFAMTIGGFDTTANTLAYSIMCLTLHPEWQDWIFSEIDKVQELHPDAEYSTTFPLLTRSLAIMYETLRLYTLVPTIVRKTPQAQTIKNINFAPETSVHLNTSAIHTLPSIWGPDSLDFRPSRWLEMTSSSGTETETETLRDPPKGTFLAWSHGPRYCPGMKMSQVEFVGVLYEIFRKWKVQIVRRNGETQEDARRRLVGILEDSSPKLTLQVNRPQDVVFDWVLRA
ncbi:cytochrome P450 [Sclerotinia borealis F-4128]|uniref:Cytochrome P450 n=1 Tax=Sclerotinia borealis (strain F-4128) TaxID=1432307 RepID=W9CPB2_SCLBF|nr:cytochrome P450 [Sclerotinia borealis F-4128]